MATREAATTLPVPVLDPPARILLVVAPYYTAIAEAQLSGARAALETGDAMHEAICVPGALEIAPAIRLASRSGQYDGYVALGCVIRGETTHYETVCEESARGITILGVQEGLAIGNGILTCETLAQAQSRADPAGEDKGGGAARAALHLVALARRFAPGPGWPDSGPGGGPGGGPGETQDMLIAGSAYPRTA